MEGIFVWYRAWGGQIAGWLHKRRSQAADVNRVSDEHDHIEGGCETEPVSEDTVLRKSRNRWDDVPLQKKVTLMIAATLIWGVVVGMFESLMGYQVFPMLLGITFCFAAMMYLGQRWITEPYDRLVHRLEVISRSRQSARLKDLPADRHDEIGRIARAMRDVCTVAIQHDMEAKHLRRTLDSKITQATQRATRVLSDMAMRDPLTNVGNRRFLDQHLESLAEASRSSRMDLICLLIDVDHFKAVNDKHGHAAGDELLVFVAELIIASVRHDDLKVRLGGDEFMVLLPGASVEYAHKLSGQLHTLFNQQIRMKYPGGPRATLSIGISSLNGDNCLSGAELMEKADKHLYTAKRSGRNRTADKTLPAAG